MTQLPPIHRRPRRAFRALLPLLVVAAGCGDLTSTTTTGAAPTSGAPLDTGAGAPITLDYAISGNPIVGQAVAIDISLETTLEDRPITLTWRAPEALSLEFPEAQAASVQIVPVAGARPRPQQVTVIPQRDGRIFLTVAATVETDTGAVTRSMSVPLDVTRRPPDGAAGND